MLDGIGYTALICGSIVGLAVLLGGIHWAYKSWRSLDPSYMRMKAAQSDDYDLDETRLDDQAAFMDKWQKMRNAKAGTL